MRDRVWSASRVASGGSLAIWAALFWFLIASDRTPFYLSSRTVWLAYVGAIVLTVGAVGRLATARHHEAEPLQRGSVGRLALVVVPAIAIMAFPPNTLGSYAAARRTTFGGTAYAASTSTISGSGDLSLLDVFGAIRSPDGMKALAARAGTESSFVGFVTTNPGDGPDEFTLNRFLITCCPGDAVTVSARIVGASPGAVEEDQWVRVTGQVYPLGREIVVDASEVTVVPRPERPYLSP